jgi:hypothetical protein
VYPCEVDRKLNIRHIHFLSADFLFILSLYLMTYANIWNNQHGPSQLEFANIKTKSSNKNKKLLLHYIDKTRYTLSGVEVYQKRKETRIPSPSCVLAWQNIWPIFYIYGIVEIACKAAASISASILTTCSGMGWGVGKWSPVAWNPFSSAIQVTVITAPSGLVNEKAPLETVPLPSPICFWLPLSLTTIPCPVSKLQKK